MDRKAILNEIVNLYEIFLYLSQFCEEAHVGVEALMDTVNNAEYVAVPLSEALAANTASAKTGDFPRDAAAMRQSIRTRLDYLRNGNTPPKLTIQ